MLYRQGWLKRDVPESRCESVADHSYMTAMLAWVTALHHAPEIDIQRVLELALVHELGEVYAGDLTPDDGITAEEKYQREYDSVKKICENLPGGEILEQRWLEFEEGSSPEACFVKQLDRLEMAIMARFYQTDSNLDPAEFFGSARERMSHPDLKEILKFSMNPEKELEPDIHRG